MYPLLVKLHKLQENQGFQNKNNSKLQGSNCALALTLVSTNHVLDCLLRPTPAQRQRSCLRAAPRSNHPAAARNSKAARYAVCELGFRFGGIFWLTVEEALGGAARRRRGRAEHCRGGDVRAAPLGDETRWSRDEQTYCFFIDAGLLFFIYPRVESAGPHIRRGAYKAETNVQTSHVHGLIDEGGPLSGFRDQGGKTDYRKR
jgi:hypothetical protein